MSVWRCLLPMGARLTLLERACGLEPLARWPGERDATYRERRLLRLERFVSMRRRAS